MATAGFSPTEGTRECDESLADRVLSLVAMVGAVSGAVGGTVLGVEADIAFPVACGTLGTMLGGGLAAGGWCLLDRLWTRQADSSADQREQNHTPEWTDASGVRRMGNECGSGEARASAPGMCKPASANHSSEAPVSSPGGVQSFLT
jgi:hypothetical protein